MVDAWVRAAPIEGGTAAVYFRIDNGGPGDDSLLRAESDAAASVEIHRTMVEGEVVHMMPSAKVPIAAGEQMLFEPGGAHLMLVGLTRRLLPGDQVEVVLHFAAGGEVRFLAPVQAP